MPSTKRALALVALLSVAGTYAWLFTLVTDGYMPSWSDEYAYFAEARSFYENSTLRGVFLFSEKGSSLGDFGCHGFAYALLHGLIAKMADFHQLNMVVTNLFMIVLSVAVLCTSRSFSFSQKSVITLTALTYFMVPMYAFTYMQETVQLLFAFLAGILLVNMYGNPGNHGFKLLYILLLIIASMFRPSWMIWTVALVPLVRNGKQFAAFAGLFLLSLGCSFILMKLFMAPYPFGFVASLPQITGAEDVWTTSNLIFLNVRSNLGAYLAGGLDKPVFYIVSKYVLVILAIYFLFLARCRQDSLALAVFLIAFVNMLILFVAYDAFDWREHRVLAPLFYLFSIVLIYRNQRVITGLLVIFLMLSLPSVIVQTREWMSEKRQVAQTFERNPRVVDSFDKIALLIDDNRVTTVLASPYFLTDSSIYPLCLPVRNSSGWGIRYAFNFHGEDARIINAASIDYLLTYGPMHRKGFRLVHGDRTFHLYKRVR